MSLLNKKEEIEKKFEMVIASSNDLKKQINFVNFDSHEKTKPWLRNFHKLETIFNEVEIKNCFANYGFNHLRLNQNFSFERQRNSENLSFQTGVLRTNCLECLDRTNLIQYIFSKKITSIMLNHLLNKELDVPSYNTMNHYKEIDESLRVLWAENGDQLSLAYSSGKSLFSDVVRNNRRSLIGIVLDIKNGLTRYINNNFFDGYNQDCHDIFLCKLTPKRSIFEEHSKLGIIFCMLFIGITIILIKSYVLKEVEQYTNLNFLVTSFTYTICLYMSIMILSHFSSYIVDSPSLKGNSYYF